MDLEKYKKATRSGNGIRRIYISYPETHPAYKRISEYRNVKRINIEELVWEEFIKKLPSDVKEEKTQ